MISSSTIPYVSYFNICEVKMHLALDGVSKLINSVFSFLVVHKTTTNHIVAKILTNETVFF